MKGLLFFLFVPLFFMPTPTFAKPANADLVVPSPEADAMQDAIQAQKLKEAEVSEDAAQNRMPPPPDTESHLELVPEYETKPIPRLKKKMRDGTYIYKIKPSPQKYSADFRIGSYDPSNLQGSGGYGTSYSELYGGGTIMLSGSFEKQFVQNAGKLGWKVGMGVFLGRGNGIFVHDYDGVEPNVDFTLYGIPLSVGLMYHLQFWDTQFLVPFAEAGGDYFLLLETRDDKPNIASALSFGGAAACHFGAGLQLQLDFLDRQGMLELDRDTGINHIYLIGDMRDIVGLSATYDMSSMVYEGGFLFEF